MSEFKYLAEVYAKLRRGRWPTVFGARQALLAPPGVQPVRRRPGNM